MPGNSQEDLLQNFRKELFDEDILHEGDSVGTDDETLLRFLRARKFNLEQSKKMFRDCQEWRRTVEGVGIDELYRRIDPFDYPERQAVFSCWPMYFHKTDKKGRPLNVHFLGGFDLPKLSKECPPEKHWQTVLVNAESLTREILPGAARKAGKPVGAVLVIVDLKGFGLSKFWQMKSLARDSFQISQDYYPETMGQLAIVNAPSSFTFIWSVIRPWLSKETADKVDILGSDYKDVLLNLVDAESLPSVLGGTCTCGAEGGCDLSGSGPWLDGRTGWGPKSKSKPNADAETKDGGEETLTSEPEALNGHDKILDPTKESLNGVHVAELDGKSQTSESSSNSAEDLEHDSPSLAEQQEEHPPVEVSPNEQFSSKLTVE